MATRYKPKVERYETLKDVDAALRELGMAERSLEALDAQAEEEIAHVRERAAKAGEKDRAKIEEITARLGAFAEYKKAETFKDRKSLDLTFGTIGYRQSTSISVKKTTVELLKKVGLEGCIRIKEEPDKDALAMLDDESLSQVDAVRKIKDCFFCETNREAINAELVKAARVQV